MEYEKIKQIINDMENSKLTELAIDFSDGTKISMKKEASQVVCQNKVEIPQAVDANNNEVANIKQEDKKQGNIVKSPMVGTFYTKSSPTAQPYVEVGKRVKKGDVLCIIEAMKLMNEIESEYDGEIAEVFVKDGEPVEYGKELFSII